MTLQMVCMVCCECGGGNEYELEEIENCADKTVLMCEGCLENHAYYYECVGCEYRSYSDTNFKEINDFTLCTDCWERHHDR